MSTAGSRGRRALRSARRGVARWVRAADASISSIRLRTARRQILVRDDGDSGPLLVVVPDGRSFGRYLVEILRAEGIGSFDVIPLSRLSEPMLAAHDIVLLAECRVDDAALELLDRWIAGGGGLVAMRPDPRVASLVGLHASGPGVADGHLRVDTSCPPGAGISDRVMQFHGPADRYDLDGAVAVAALVEHDGSSRRAPAVTRFQATERGGVAFAFAYDLARSVVYTRQGNPSWAGQNRDGDLVVRSNDLFFGGAHHDAQPDWVDRDLRDLPQADEQQRLLVNILHELSRDRPLARFWYLPRGLRAAVVMTGDDHGGNGTSDRFDEYRQIDPVDGSAEHWGCVRATSYVVPETPLTDAAAAELVRQGFEISVHVTTEDDRFTPGSLHRDLRRELKAFRRRFPSLPAPVSHRAHCVPWSDWSTLPEVERVHGIRLDTNYYYFPATWVEDRPGLFTGSGLPMRFATVEGDVIDCYQAVTQLTDESAQTYPTTIETLLDRAIDPDGHVAVLTANMHTDLAASNGADAIVVAARARGVPVISAAQLLRWIDARAGSTIGQARRTARSITATVRVHPDAHGLVALVPLGADQRAAVSVTCGDRAVSFTHQVHAGVTHVAFPAESGTYAISCSSEPTSDPLEGDPRPPIGDRPDAPDRIEPVRHSTCEDFAGGELDGTRVSGAHGGCIVLRPHQGFDLAVDDPVEALDGWRVRTEAGGAAEIIDRALRLRRGVVEAEDLLTPGRAIEIVATLSPNAGQRFGLVADGMVAAFTAGPAGELVVLAGSEPSLRTASVPGPWTSGPHRFTIYWAEGLVSFLVDGVPVVRHRLALGSPLRPTLEVTGADVDLAVHRIRISPYPSTATYTSRVVDAGRAVRWGRASVVAIAQSMTAARVSLRTGATPVSDATWSGWHLADLTGGSPTGRARYAQYRLHLSTAWQVSPEVQAVTLERFA
ncbi:MAG: hypothetical protein ACT4OV_03065 [Microthrixaceae bacterium]